MLRVIQKHSLQTLRGLACVLLVAYHVVGDDPQHGLHVTDGPLRLVNDGLACLRMPLFAFLAGIACALRSRDARPLHIVKDKARSLLLPMLSVGTLFALARAATPGTNDQALDWAHLHLLPVGHFWFVESLFLLFVLVALAQGLRLLDSPPALIIGWLLSALLSLLVIGPLELGIRGAIYLLPYFWGGLVLVRCRLFESLASLHVRLLLAVLLWVSLWLLGVPEPNPDRRTLPMLLASTCVCLLVLGLRPNVGLLARIGADSYAVFLFHIFFTAAARIALARSGVESVAVQLPVGVMVGLCGPMVVANLLAGRGWCATVLLGQRPRRPAAPTKTADAPS